MAASDSRNGGGADGSFLDNGRVAEFSYTAQVFVVIASIALVPLIGTPPKIAGYDKVKLLKPAGKEVKNAVLTDKHRLFRRLGFHLVGETPKSPKIAVGPMNIKRNRVHSFRGVSTIFEKKYANIDQQNKIK
jgi:hypothetical protein